MKQILQTLASELAETPAGRRFLRAMCDAPSHLPITVTGSAKPPRVTGTGYHHVTPSGELCRHPSAYRRAFGRPVYVASTISVEVGGDWHAMLLGRGA